MRYPRFSVRCGVVITKGPVVPAPPSTYAHPDVSSNHWDNILDRPRTGLLRTAHLKRIPDESLLALSSFPFARTDPC